MISPGDNRKRVSWGTVTAFCGAVLAALYAMILGLTADAFDVQEWRWWLAAAAVVATILAGAVAMKTAPSGIPASGEPVPDPPDQPHPDKSEPTPTPTATADERLWRVPEPEEGVVERPDLAGKLVELLARRCNGIVGVTTALFGAGGFGKTTLVRQVASRQEVQERFPGGCLSVEIGENLTDADLAEKVNDLSEQLCGRRPTDTDPYQAGLTLGGLLEKRPDVLLVIDDVWSSDQLRPFLLDGPHCTRLVTTRRPSVLPTGAARVWVDQMRPEQGSAVLTTGIKGLPCPEVGRLLELTGQWPLLLSLANRRLRADVASGVAPVTAARRMVQRLADDGPATLDLADEDSRDRAVRASVRASIDLLDSDAQTRFAELGIFPSGAEIPRDVLTLLWGATGGLAELEVARLCERLADMSLIVEHLPDTGAIRLHDVIRAYLRRESGPHQLTSTNGRLLDAAFTGLLASASAGASKAGGLARAAVEVGRTAADVTQTAVLQPVDEGPRPWWRLPGGAGYLWQHLGYHLAEAALGKELATLACDLRWVSAKLHRLGPGAVEADLARVDSHISNALRRVIGRAAHLLGPIQPANALTNTLLSRLDNDVTLRSLGQAYASAAPGPALISKLPLPDQPDAALCRVLRGHDGWVSGCAVAPDGTWIATSGWDATVQLWDVATGQHRRVLKGDDNVVLGCAVSPDGSWLVSCGWDGTARVWDAATGQQRVELRGHKGWVSACAVSPDGAFVVTGGRDGTVRVWCAVTGQCWRVLEGHDDVVLGCAVSPDGSWLVTCGRDGTARIWETATGRQRLLLGGHDGWVSACAAAPDGSFVVTGGRDGTVRVWDAATGEQRLTWEGHDGAVEGCAVSPDGSWVVTGGADGTARIWDVATGARRRVLKGHRGAVLRCAVAPDGSQIVTCGWDGTVRIWDAPGEQPQWAPDDRRNGAVEGCAVARDRSFIVTCGRDGSVRMFDPTTGELRRVLGEHRGGASCCAVARDGSFAVTCGWDRTARVWDTATGEELRVLAGHDGWVLGCAVAPDGAWIVTGGSDETARIWDTASGRQLRVLAGHHGAVSRCRVAPDGSWIVTCGWDGTARIWDPETGRQRLVFRGHDGAVEGRAVAPDGSWIVTCGRDGTARVWDPRTGRQRLVLRGHKDWVYGCAVSPDGSAIVTCGSDGTARVWDTATGECTTAIQVDGALRDCCWQTDGRTICCTGDHGLYLFTYKPPPR